MSLKAMESVRRLCDSPDMRNERADRVVSVMLTPSLYKKLKAQASANGRTTSGEVRHILTGLLTTKGVKK